MGDIGLRACLCLLINSDSVIVISVYNNCWCMCTRLNCLQYPSLLPNMQISTILTQSFR